MRPRWMMGCASVAAATLVMGGVVCCRRSVSKSAPAAERAAVAVAPLAVAEGPNDAPRARGLDARKGAGSGGAPKRSEIMAEGNLGLMGAAPLGKRIEGEPLTAPPAERLPLIDPNGRFATTYRPGGGHLAAFESAVARGIIPAGEREVVSDVGARYAPVVAPPKGKAMVLRTDLEREKLPPGGGPFHVRVALQSTADKALGRPHLSVHLVLDVSGSMAGESITRAREAARALVDKLAPSDDFSLVTFSNEAAVKVSDGPVGARRDAIKQTIAEVHEGGGTNIGGALTLGYAQAATKGIPEDAVRVVLLLSDGRANVGITAPDKLSKLALDAFQTGVQTSAFGLGSDYDGALMSSIAAEGAGGYYYLRDAEQITSALSTEIDRRLDPVATAVEVRVRLKKDIGLLRVYGSRRLTGEETARVRAQEVAADKQAEKRDHIAKDRQDDQEGGMRFFIPAFAPNDSHALLFQVAVPPGEGSRGLAIVELKYKDRVTKKNVVDEFPIKMSYAANDAASGATIDPSMARTVQGFAAGETLSDAANRIARGDRDGAISALAEREQILRHAAESLKEPLFLKDADRLARLRLHAGSRTGIGDPLVLALLLETASRTHLH